MEEVDIISEKENLNVELTENKHKYDFEIQITKNLLEISLYLENELKYERYLSLSDIKKQIYEFFDYDINKIYKEIKKLSKDKFKISKNDNKYELSIEFVILNKKKKLIIDLEESNNIKLDSNTFLKAKKAKKNKNCYLSMFISFVILLVIFIISFFCFDIFPLRKKEKKNLYDNFSISLREPIHILKHNNYYISCSTMLKDGRFATGSADNSIIIYNKKTFKPDLIIKEHNHTISKIIQLNSGLLASCSYDNTIKLYKITYKKYQVMQTLKGNIKRVEDLIELNNTKLVSSSFENYTIFYQKDNNEYKIDYSLYIYRHPEYLIQTKENELCISEYYNNSIIFFDLNERRIITIINNINYCKSLTMISKDLLMVTGKEEIILINVFSYKIIRTIKVPNSSQIYNACMLNESQLLTCDESGKILQWRIEKDNLILTSKKEIAHNYFIYTLIKIGDGHILSCGAEGVCKIW